MGIWDKLIGKSSEIRPSSEGFGWSKQGAATTYLLVSFESGQPHADLFNTSRESRLELLERLENMGREHLPHLLLGVEALEVFTNFYCLDPSEAMWRLG